MGLNALSRGGLEDQKIKASVRESGKLRAEGNFPTGRTVADIEHARSKRAGQLLRLRAKARRKGVILKPLAKGSMLKPRKNRGAMVKPQAKG